MAVETGARARTRSSLAVLLFATMFPQTVVSMMSLAPPVMAKEMGAGLGLPPETAGIYTGLIYAFVLIGNMLSAPLMERLGPLRLSFGCVVAAGLGLALMTAAWLPAILLATALIGFCYGPLTPASAQVISGERHQPGFALFVSIRQTAVPLGGMLAGLLVPVLVLRGSWQMACLALAAGSALGAIVFALGSPLVRNERRAGGIQPRRGLLAPLRLILGRSALLTLALSSMLFGALQLILSAFLVVYLVTEVGHSLVTAGALLSASQLAGVGGRIFWGYAADRMGAPRRLMVLVGLGMAAACIATSLLVWVGATWLSLPVALMFGATASGWNGVYLAEVMREVEPAEAGLATSGSLLFTYVGVVIGPPVFAGLAALAGMPAAYVASAVIALVGAWLVRPRPERASAA